MEYQQCESHQHVGCSLNDKCLLKDTAMFIKFEWVWWLYLPMVIYGYTFSFVVFWVMLEQVPISPLVFKESL